MSKESNGPSSRPSAQGIESSLLGMLSIVYLVLLNIPPSAGDPFFAVCVMLLLMNAVGIGLGVAGLRKNDTVFSILGILLNGIVVVGIVLPEVF